MIKEFFGSLMRQARADLGVTLRELALKVGCAPSFLSEVENGLRPAPKDKSTLEKIAKALNLDWDRVVEAAKNDRARRDMKIVKELFAQDDALAACYCRAKEHCSEEELRKLFMEVFERAATFNKRSNDV